MLERAYALLLRPVSKLKPQDNRYWSQQGRVMFSFFQARLQHDELALSD